MQCFGGPEAAALARRIVIENTSIWRSRGKLERPLSPPARGPQGELRVPVLAIAGGRHPSDTPSVTRELAAAIAGAELVVVEDAGHFVDIEAPDTFLATVERSLERALPLP